MSVSNIQPHIPIADVQPSSQRSDPPATANPSASRQVQDENRDVKAGNVTSPEKVSGDVKVDAIDSRKPDVGQRSRRRRLDTKA